MQSLFDSNRPYVPKNRKKYLTKFQTHSSTTSLYYNYVQSPMCSWIVDNLMPEWVAPNLITFTAHAMIWLALLIVAVGFGPAPSGPIDNWACFACGFCYFLYNTLDNCDGK